MRAIFDVYRKDNETCTLITDYGKTGNEQGICRVEFRENGHLYARIEGLRCNEDLDTIWGWVWCGHGVIR